MSERIVAFTPSQVSRIGKVVGTVEDGLARKNAPGMRGTRPPRPRRGDFRVFVEKDGGADGTKTTKATWTYTVYSLSGAELGTAVAVARPRPNGKMAFQAGDTGYGIAFYDGTTLKLWDAGEVPGTAGC